MTQPGESAAEKIAPVRAVVNDPQSVYTAIESRFCCRAFHSRPVDRAVIERILSVATYAPSGSNNQPWRVYVVQGASRDALVRKVCDAHDASRTDAELAASYQPQYQYYPREWTQPYLGRRRVSGFGLYKTLGIEKGDVDRMHEQHQRNFKFFDAPVGIFFTNESTMEQGAMVDTAMFVQSVMVAARAEGLHTCVQVAWNTYSSIVLPHIGADGEKLVCGLSLGFAIVEEPVNYWRPPRENIDVFTRWVE